MGALASRIRNFFGALLTSGRLRPWRSLAVLLVGLATITAWQANLAAHPDRIDARYKITASAA